MKLILFFKALVVGEVKKRLAVSVGSEKALMVYKSMVKDLMSALAPLYPITVPYVSPDENKAIARFENILRKPVRKQSEGDLGDKMYNAFYEVFREGAEKAVLIGSDIPHIEKSLIMDFFDRLVDFPAVIGPSVDGGYYLIGFRKDSLTKSLFEGIRWGTDKVFEETQQRMENSGITFFIGEKLRDIDTIEDLRIVLENEVCRALLPRVCATAKKVLNRYERRTQWQANPCGRAVHSAGTVDLSIHEPDRREAFS
jgi:uncharacterized protein